MKIIGQRITEVFLKISRALFFNKGGNGAAPKEGPESVKIRSGYMAPKEFIETYYPYARQIEIDSGCPAVFILAQAALESGWNQYRIGKNALFGVKADETEKNKVLRLTWEILNNPNEKFPVIIKVRPIGVNQYRYKVKDWFRDYDSPAECFRDHLEVLRKPWFSEAWKYTDDPYKFAECIARGAIYNGKRRKYATDPKYENSLKNLIRDIEPYIKAMENE